MREKPRSLRNGAAAGARLKGPAGVWLLALGAAVLAAVIAFALRDAGRVGEGPELPWWLLAMAFYAAEIAVVHMRFRKDAHSVSMSEIPFVLGLYLVAPLQFFAAQLLGTGVALAVNRRQRGAKLCFNLSQFALQAGVGLLVFRGFVGSGDPLGAAGLSGALVATLLALLVADALINAAIRLSGGEIDVRSMIQVFGLSSVAVAANTAVAIGCVALVWSRPEAVWLAAAPAAALFLGYRAYLAQRTGRIRREAIGAMGRALHERREPTERVLETAIRARAIFDAEFAEVYLFPNGGHRGAYRTAAGPGDRNESMSPVEVDPDMLFWRRTLGAGEAALVELGDDEIVVDAGVQLRNAMAAPLRGPAGPVGAIVVGNRLGDLGPFDGADVGALETLASQVSLSLLSAAAPRPSR